MEKPDGGQLLATLLRSVEWLDTQNAEPGNTIRLTFVELGIDGPADVLAVEACPTIESGNSRVVTGTFRHSAANVIDLYVTSDDQPIGTTANHPFWSETRQDFVQAGTLQPGEKLRTATGASAHVRQLIPRPGSAEVFNLEVDAEHCYAVGRNGLVVHNSDNYDDELPNVAPNRKVSLGIEQHLDDFSRKHGADSWKVWAKKAPMAWKGKFYDVMNDKKSEILFNLDGVDVWGGVTRASRNAGGATDWELLQIYSNKEWWSRIKWMKDGESVANPFE